MATQVSDVTEVQLAEVIAALSLATDLAMGQLLKSEKAIDNHGPHICAKIGFSTRDGATLGCVRKLL